MAPVRVVPSLNPGEDCQTCLGVRLPITPVNEFAFQCRKEAFCHGVVIGIAHGAHARAYAHFFAALAKRHAGVPGGFNRSSQHLTQGGVYGPTCKLDAEINGAGCDAVTWSADASLPLVARIQLRMLVSWQPNSLANSLGLRPAATSSMICWRNCAGYGGLGLYFLGIADSFLT